MEKKKVVVGMSGGVDSSVAAYLLKKDGYDVIGVTMKTWSGEGAEGQKKTLEDAKKVSDMLEIPHYIVDFSEQFEAEVISNFLGEYQRGRTPNPCVVCNRKIKWQALMQWGKEIGADYVATGHYAKIVRLENGRYAVKRAETAKKDQTYALCGLTQEQLAHTMMPVGMYEKEEIRRIAKEAGIPVADKPDSMEICFIPDDDYAGFIEKRIGKAAEEGNFVTADGTILGQHKGIIHYTVGQRKGLNLAMGKPVFVSEIRPETNEVVIGDNEDVFSRALLCDHINFMGMENLDKERMVTAKIRYHHPGAPCTIQKWKDGTVLCTFEQPQRAITPGQSVVFYEDDIVMGSGRIIKAWKQSFPDRADDSGTPYTDGIHTHSEELEE